MTENRQRLHGRPAQGEAIVSTAILPLEAYDGVWRVYFATCRPRLLLKVGCSQEILKRTHKLSVQLGAPLQVEAVLPGAHQTERRIHSLLWTHRVAGEWFRLSFVIETILCEIRSTGAWSRAPWAGDEFPPQVQP